MQRLGLFLLIVAASSSALAFDPTPIRGNRIGILTTIPEDNHPDTIRVAAIMRGYLSRELRRAGFDVFDERATYPEILERGPGDADYYVEFIEGYSSDSAYGGVGIAGRHGGVDLGLVGTHIAAGLRVYDARTLQVIDEFSVEERDRAVAPTAIGIGGRHVGIWVGLPLRYFRHRSVARQAAKDAAQSIAGILETEAARQ